MRFQFLAMAALGRGVSGGDRIFIELAKRWSNQHEVIINTWEEGQKMCQRLGLEGGTNLRFNLIAVGFWCRLGFMLCYLSRIIAAIFAAIRFLLNSNIRLSIIVHRIVSCPKYCWISLCVCFEWIVSS